MRYMDIKPHRATCPHCYHILRFLRSLPTFGGIQKDAAWLIVPNKKQPCRSVILKEVVA